TPLVLQLTLKASPTDSSNIKFPYISSTDMKQNLPLEQKKQAISYLSYKTNLLKTGNYFASSQWQDRTLNNLHDNDPDTVWEADRVLWQKGNESFGIDFGGEQTLSKFVWLNGFANNTPTKYIIETSLDNSNWTPAKAIENTQRIEPNIPQIVDLGSVST